MPPSPRRSGPKRAANPEGVFSMAQADYYLKLDGIEGESSDDKHKGTIEILSFSLGAQQAGTGGAGGGHRSEERRVGKRGDLGGRRIIKKKKENACRWAKA